MFMCPSSQKRYEQIYRDPLLSSDLSQYSGDACFVCRFDPYRKKSVSILLRKA
jgi:hypothetical protein